MKYTILLLLICSRATAQKLPDYIVYLVKGEVTARGKNEAPVPLKQNQFIYSSQTILVTKGAEITLSNKEGASFVLNSPGTYPVRLLAGKKSPPVDNLTQKYLYLLYHDLLDPGHDYNKFKKQNVGGVWGGVNRSGECGNLLFPVQGARTSDNTLFFKWRKTNALNNYVLKIYSDEAKEVISLPVKDTSYALDLANFTTMAKGKYYWRIQSEASACEDETPFAFELITREEEEQIIGGLEKAGTDLSQKFAIVNKLENFGLVTAARKYLWSIVNNNDGNRTLAKTYSWFLLKYGLEQEAAEAWEKSLNMK